MLNFALYLTYALIFIAIIGVMAGVVNRMLQDKKKGMIFGGGLVFIIIVYFIGSALSAGDTEAYNAANITSGQIKSANGGLIAFYVLLVIALVLFAVDLVRGFMQSMR